MWTLWEKFAPGDARTNMRMFVTLSISNKITLSLIRRALDSVKKDLSTTPFNFNMDSEAGKALSSTAVQPPRFTMLSLTTSKGSPNGKGFPHFLITRKAQVGLKRIIGVMVLECSNAAKTPCMVYIVEDMDRPVPRPKEEKPQGDPSKAPKEGEDPNTKDDPKDTTDDKGPGKPGKPINDGGLRKRGIVREHVFRLDVTGKLTQSISFR